MEPRLKWTKIILTAKIDTDTWYLILDVGLSKQKLLYAALCTTIQAILEVVYRTCGDHSTWKTVPDIDDALTEKTWPGTRMTPLDCHLELVTTKVVDTCTAFKKSSIFTLSLPVTIVDTCTAFKKSSIFTLSLPVTILKVSVKSPLSRLFSSVVNPNSCRRSAYSNLFNPRPTTSFVALLCTCSRQFISFLREGDHACILNSKSGLT